MCFYVTIYTCKNTIINFVYKDYCNFVAPTYVFGGMRWCHSATSQKVMGSIPNGFPGMFR